MLVHCVPIFFHLSAAYLLISDSVCVCMFSYVHSHSCVPICWRSHMTDKQNRW